MVTAWGVSSDHLENPLDDLEIVRAMLGSKDAEVTIEPGSGARRVLGDRVRASLKRRTGRDHSHLSDAETLDGVEYFLFPNFMPWAGYLTPFAYRFRPDRHDPDSCVMDIMVLEPLPAGEPRPPAAQTRPLGPDESWSDAPELGVVGRVVNQDGSTFGRLQRGLPACVRATPPLPRHPE